jgi:hypothetical protein
MNATEQDIDLESVWALEEFALLMTLILSESTTRPRKPCGDSPGLKTMQLQKTNY